MDNGVLHDVLLEHVFFPPAMSTLTGHYCDTLWYLGLLSEPFMPTLTFKTVLDNVLLKHGGLPCVLPFGVHLDFGHLPDTQRYLGLLTLISSTSWQCSP